MAHRDLLQSARNVHLRENSCADLCFRRRCRHRLPRRLCRLSGRILRLQLVADPARRAVDGTERHVAIAVSNRPTFQQLPIGGLLRPLGNHPVARRHKIEKTLQVRQAGDALLSEKDDRVLTI